TLSVAALQRITRTLPIVFAGVPDPVGAGFVDGLARPGGNATGFMNYEYSLSGKWLELLKQIAPSVKRAAVLRNSGGHLSGRGSAAASDTHHTDRLCARGRSCWTGLRVESRATRRQHHRDQQL